MATDFKSQRFQELFDALDPDRNDVVGKHSFDNLISRLAHNSDTNIDDLRKAFHEFWRTVQSRSGASGAVGCGSRGNSAHRPPRRTP